MRKEVLLIDALTDVKRYGDFTTRFIDYKPKEEYITLSSKMTGYFQKQVLKTENNLKWNPFVGEDDEIYIISSEPTIKKVILRGCVGSKKGNKSVALYSMIYSNYNLGAKGVPLTAKLFKGMPKSLKENSGSYWLPRLIRCYNGNRSYIGLNVVHSGMIDNIPLYYIKTGKKIVADYSIRPVVKLQKDTKVMVDRNVDHKKPLEIFI